MHRDPARASRFSTNDMHGAQAANAVASAPPRRQSTRVTNPPQSPLAFRDYRLFWIARFSMVLAQLAMVVIIGWQVYDHARADLGMTPREAAFQLGMIGIAQFLPLLVLTPFAGLAADRVDRRWLACGAVLLDMLNALALAWFTYTDAITLPVLFTIAALHGVVRVFAGPSMTALAPNLVPPEVLPRAIAMSSIAWQSASVAGPALGGYLYAARADLPYWVSTVLLAIAALALVAIRRKPQINLAGQAHPFRQILDGVHYVRENKLVLGAISLDLFAVLLGGATALLPVYARDILHVGPEGLGHLRAAPALGAALTAIWFSFRPLRTRVGVKMLWAVAAYGAATVVFGLSKELVISLVMLALLGAADMLSVYVRGSLIAIHTPDEMRGRVASVSMLFISGSNELGEAQSGVAAALLGPVGAVVFGGFGAIAVTALWSRLFPELRNARNFDPPDRLVRLKEKTT